MRPVTVTVGPLAAASANAICLSQTPTTGALTLNGALASGGVVTMDSPRRALLTTTADETSRTFTFVGTDRNGSPQTEVLAGVNATTAQAALDWKTITAITISGNAAGALTIGTSGVASSMWVRLDEWAPAATAIQCTVTGTVNYTIEQSVQDPNSPTNPVLPYQMTWLSSPDVSVVGATTTQQSYYVATPPWTRVTLNSGTGSVSAVFSQNSVVPY